MALFAAGSWHCASIQYGKYLLELMIETEDEGIAWREAEELCAMFDEPAILRGVT
jgi:hypothetical protein